MKPPRGKGNTCDYCDTSKGGLAAFNNRVNIFCGPNCEGHFINCVYGKSPDQYELPLYKS